MNAEKIFRCVSEKEKTLYELVLNEVLNVFHIAKVVNSPLMQEIAQSEDLSIDVFLERIANKVKERAL